MSIHSDEHFSSDEELRQRLTCACPKCAQLLVLMDDQLDAAEGWVRCSNCEQVFLALACLLDANSWGPNGGAHSSKGGNASGVVTNTNTNANANANSHANSRANAPQQGPSSQPNADPNTATPNALRPISIDEFLHRQSLVNSSKQQASGHHQYPEPSLGMRVLEQAREEVRVHPRQTKTRSWMFWNVGLLMALVLLPLVFTLRFRNEVAALYPGVKPTLVQICQWLQCQVEWPRDLSALSIESSSLEKEELSDAEAQQSASAKNKRIKYHLSIRIKNSFSYPLAAPQIKLTLVDEKDQVLLEQRLGMPLGEEASVIKPGALNQFQLPIEWDSSQSRLPSGYRVELE